MKQGQVLDGERTACDKPAMLEPSSSRIALLCVLALVAFASSPIRASAPPQQQLVITDVTVIDVERGRSLAARTVLVDNGLIVAIGRSGKFPIPPLARRIDGRGRFLLPGLMDMHVHLFNNYSRRAPNEWAFPLFIGNGVTAVREMGANAASMVQVRQWHEALAAGELLAPRVLAVGYVVGSATPTQGSQQVAQAAEAGAEFVKVFSNLPPAHWRAIMDSATAHGLRVTGHVPAGLSLLAAASAGQASTEHLTQASEACSTEEARLLAARAELAPEAWGASLDAEEAQSFARYDARTCKRVAKALAATGQPQVPTLVLAYQQGRGDHAALDADPLWSLLRIDERARWQRIAGGLTDIESAQATRRWSGMRRIAAEFIDAKVPMLAGTDTPMPWIYPGESMYVELELLVDAGLSSREALRAATLAPDEFLGHSRTLGSIAVGKRADLLLLDADPVANIRNSQRIRAVILDGRLLDRQALDRMLGRR